MASPTLFTKIIQREIPANIVYEDEHCVAFTDVNPQAPTHILLIPRKEVVNLADASEDDRELLGHMMLVAPKIAANAGLTDFRLVTNNGEKAGQSVFHLHLHILGGRNFSWPPG